MLNWLFLYKVLGIQCVFCAEQHIRVWTVQSSNARGCHTGGLVTPVSFTLVSGKLYLHEFLVNYFTLV